MPGRTQGDKIDELEKLVATLVERVDSVRREMTDGKKFAVVEDRVNEIKRNIEETGRRRWSVIPAVLGAIVGAVLGSFISFFLQRLIP